jgi:hypothetical protein
MNILQFCRSRWQRMDWSATEHPVDRKERIAVLKGDHLYAREHGAVKYLASAGGLLRPGGCGAEENHEYDDGYADLENSCAQVTLWVHSRKSMAGFHRGQGLDSDESDRPGCRSFYEDDWFPRCMRVPIRRLGSIVAREPNDSMELDPGR